MAKTSLVVKNRQRQQLVEKYRVQRAALRQRSKDLKLTLEERMEARAALSMLPVNSSSTRRSQRADMTMCRSAYSSCARLPAGRPSRKGRRGRLRLHT